MTTSESIENTEEREKILYRPTVLKKFPSNPKDVFKEFKVLKKDQIIKLSLSAVIIILFGVFNNIRIIGNPQPENKCYFDVVHSWTDPLNYFFRGNKGFNVFFSVFGSLTIDIIFLFSFFSWAIYAVDWRYGVNVLLFYGIRYIMNESTRLATPNLLYFPYPGFPSIVVGYLQGSDFFFSGHCGFPIVNMMEFIWMKKYWFAAYCAFVCFVEIFLMIISREHYTIDIIVGVIFSHYISLHGRNWVKFIYDHIQFLNRLKMNNRKELKRIKVDWDNGD
jgi:hypothetical protein